MRRIRQIWALAPRTGCAVPVKARSGIGAPDHCMRRCTRGRLRHSRRSRLRTPGICLEHRLQLQEAFRIPGQRVDFFGMPKAAKVQVIRTGHAPAAINPNLRKPPARLALRYAPVDDHLEMDVMFGLRYRDRLRTARIPPTYQRINAIARKGRSTGRRYFRFTSKQRQGLPLINSLPAGASLFPLLRRRERGQWLCFPRFTPQERAVSENGRCQNTP